MGFIRITKRDLFGFHGIYLDIKWDLFGFHGIYSNKKGIYSDKKWDSIYSGFDQQVMVQCFFLVGFDVRFNMG